MVADSSTCLEPVHCRQLAVHEHGVPSQRSTEILADDKRVSDPQIVVSLKGDEEAEMGLVSDIHENLREVEALKLNYSSKTLVD